MLNMDGEQETYFVDGEFKPLLLLGYPHTRPITRLVL
jgi:hypothetical protein